MAIIAQKKTELDTTLWVCQKKWEHYTDKQLEN